MLWKVAGSVAGHQGACARIVAMATDIALMGATLPSVI